MLNEQEKLVPIQQLAITRLLREVRNKPSDRRAEELVRYATVGSQDILSLVLALEQGLEFSGDKRSRKQGALILDGVDQYLRTNVVVFRSLYPWSMDPASVNLEKRLQDLMETHHRYGKGKFQPPRLSPEISYYLTERLLPAFKKYEPETLRRAILPISHPPRMRLSPEFLSASFEIINKPLANDEAGKNAYTPGEMLALLKEVPPIEGLPHPLDTKFNGVSINDLFATEHLAEATPKALEFMAGIPKGDLFWEAVVKGLFLTKQETRPGMTPMDFPEPGPTENVFLLQQDIANQLFLVPVSEGIFDDPSFDRAFTRFLENASPHLMRQLIETVYWGAVQQRITERVFHPESTLEESIGRLPLAAISEKAHFESNPKTGPYHFSDGIIHNFIHQNLAGIMSSFQERFGKSVGNKNTEFLKGAIEDIFGTPFEELHTADLVKSMEMSLGEPFLAKLDERHRELRQVSSIVLGDIQKTPIDYWPNPAAEHRIEFEEDSLPGLFSEAIHFFVPEEDYRSVAFKLFVKSTPIEIIGNVDVETMQVSLSADIETHHPGLHTIVEHVIVTSFHDLLMRKGQELRKARAKDTPGTTPKAPSLAKERKSRRSRPLPRRNFLAPERTSAGRLRQEIEKDLVERGEFTPRSVDMYTRRLAGAGEYIRARDQLIAEIRTAEPDRMEMLLNHLQIARYNLSHISGEKLKEVNSLPLPFQKAMEPVEDPALRDPETGRPVRVYTRTWVKPHFSPKLDSDDEARRPVTLYEKYYRGGPASAMWDQIKAWFFEDFEA